MAKKVTKKPEGTTKKSTPPRSRVSRASSAPAAEAASPAPSLDAIRTRAYEIFASGRHPNDPVADWFEAERELTSAGA